jgi:hypothetical protein
MVTRQTISIAITLIIVLAGWLVWINLNSDERQIKKTFETIAGLAEKKEKEAALDSLQKAAKIGKLFHDPCTITLEQQNHSDEFSRKEITDRILMVRARAQKVSVSFHDTTIQIINEKQANVTTTMYARTIENNSENADIREFDLTMIKSDGAWLIHDVTFVEVLKQ